MGWSNRALDHDRFQDELITVSIYLFFRMILSKKSATFWDLALVRSIPCAPWMRPGADFGAAAAKSQVAAMIHQKLYTGRREASRKVADPLPALNPPELT
jgi:hypothetical protein